MDAVKSLHFPWNRSYTIQDFKNAVESSNSVREALIKLNVEPKGGNYKIFYNTISKLGLDTTHFTGRGHNLGRKGVQHRGGRRKTPLSEILKENSTFQSFKLKIRLIQEGILNPSCSSCNLTIWLNESIPLELDHINGINTDNRIENLRLLCPNCHCLTPTYRGKNKSKA
jgi:5-methylcytosine-specific restriction endonuclease McrA